MKLSLGFYLLCAISMVASYRVNIQLNVDLPDTGIEGHCNHTKVTVTGQDSDCGEHCHSTGDTGNANKPKDCVEAKRDNPESGVVTIFPEGSTPLQVYCDMDTDGGGWTVFQRRQDGSVEFYRNWTEYQNGFGNVSGEFWLGLDALHLLTSRKTYELRVDLMKFDGTKGYATYSNFSISDSSDNYRLHFDNFTGGNARDSLSVKHNNKQFTTFDADHDRYSGNCAVYWHGAWWYDICHNSNLNGRYKASSVSGNDGVVWDRFDSSSSLKFTEMKMRPV